MAHVGCATFANKKLALVEQSTRRLFEGGLVEEPVVVGH